LREEGSPISDLRVLWLTRKGEGYVGAPQTHYEFEQEVAKLCECKFAGQGWGQYKEGESMDETVKRIYGDSPPDWVIDRDNNLHNKKPRNRSYKVGHFMSDLHGKHRYNTSNPVEYAELLNKVNYDAVFMRYTHIHGTSYRPDVVYDRLKCAKHWVPWSVDPDLFLPKPKTVDVSFIGTLGSCYPLRKLMWSGLYYVARGHKITRETSPRGKTYERDVESLTETHLVGKRYRDALAETRIFMFGCSTYRYPIQKFFEATASGCCVLSDAPSMAKKLGLIDGDTYVETYEEEWEDKLLVLLDDQKLVRKIARRGLKNTLEHHTHKTRATSFLEMLEG